MLVALLVAVAAARPQDAEPVKIIRQSQEHDTESGSYSFSFEAENGIKVEETGEQKVIGEEAGTVSKGSFSYPENGAIITVNWVADENGFQATGDHLPTPPPVPDHVVKLLADLAAAGLL